MLAVNLGKYGHKRRRAAAAVELAVLLPVLLFIVLGCIDFGRFASSYVAVTNAARAAAGFASDNPYTTATYSTWQIQAKAEAVQELSGAGFDSSKVVCSATGVTESGGGWRAEITVSYPFQTVVPWPGIPSQLTLSRKVVMRGTQ